MDTKQVLEDIVLSFEELTANLALELLVIHLQDLLICNLKDPFVQMAFWKWYEGRTMAKLHQFFSVYVKVWCRIKVHSCLFAIPSSLATNMSRFFLIPHKHKQLEKDYRTNSSQETTSKRSKTFGSWWCSTVGRVKASSFSESSKKSLILFSCPMVHNDPSILADSVGVSRKAAAPQESRKLHSSCFLLIWAEEYDLVNNATLLLLLWRNRETTWKKHILKSTIICHSQIWQSRVHVMESKTDLFLKSCW